MLEAALEEIERRAGVLAHRPGRVGAGAVGFGTPAKWSTRVAAGEETRAPRVARVQADELRLVGAGARPSAGAGQPDDLVAALLEEIRGPRAEEAESRR